jgi:type I restriction enzyme S subunit
MSFPRHPKYKDSGVEWLGEVPEHWEVRRLRQIGPLLKGSGGSKEDIVESGVPCVRYGDLYTTHAYFIRQARTHVSEERSADYFPIQKGDVLFAASGEDLAEIGRSAVTLIDERVCCGGDLVILRPQTTVVPEFMGYACDCWVSKAQKASMGRGTTVKHIYPDELKRLLLALPPAPEQTAIATFLDHETAKNDALIAEQQRLIELLQEKRQAVVSHAVTRGLNPDAPMKDSGIEWLGEVPEHWEIAPLRRLTARGTTITYGIVQAGPDIEGGVPYIRTSDMAGDEFPESGYLRTSEEIDRSYSRSKVRPNDLVVAIRATLGKGLLVPEFLDGANLTQGTARVSPGEKLLPRFLLHAFNGGFCQTSIDLVAKGTTFREITLDALRRIPMLVPPCGEQKEIVEFVDAAIERSDQLVADTSRAITLLQERRSALISSAVTGQIDVRGLAGSEAA